ncbi:MAG: N-6 DNA methylase [Mycobacteriales bacterium]
MSAKPKIMNQPGLLFPEEPPKVQNDFACEIIYDDFCAFFAAEGRFPRITDKKKPWEYRGWLMAYRLELEACEGIGNRWDYWSRTMLAGKLLNEPIPRVKFGFAGEEARPFKALVKHINMVESGGSGWSALSDLVGWLLWGFGISKEQPKFSERLNEELYRSFDLSPWLLEPGDYIGHWLGSQRGGRWNPTAFFPTPHHVVEAMCRMTFGESEDARAKTVMDPCVGSGRMLLHASNYSLRLYGQDIDKSVLDILQVNGALYCPWLIRAFPDSFFEIQPEAKA